MIRLSPCRAAMVLALGGLLLSTSCSPVAVQAAAYTTVPTNVLRLERHGVGHLKLGSFKTGDPKIDQQWSQGARFLAPTDWSFALYLEGALEMELREAGLLDKGAPVELSAVFLRNDLDAHGFQQAHADLEVRFILRRGERVTFDKVLRVRHEWMQRYPVANALLSTQASYVNGVQTLLVGLFSDPDFLAAAKA